MRVSRTEFRSELRTDTVNDSIVEFATRDDAMRAIKELSEQRLLGRSCFIREVGRSRPRTPHAHNADIHHRHAQDREQSARFGAAPIPGRIGQAMGEGGYGGRGGFRGGARGAYGGPPSAFPRAGVVAPDFKQLFVENVSRSCSLLYVKTLC